MSLGNSSSPPTAPISCGSISPTRRQHCVAKPGPHPLITSLLRFFVYDEKCDPLFSAPYTLFLICNSFKPLYFVVPAHSLRKTPGGGGAPHLHNFRPARNSFGMCISARTKTTRIRPHHSLSGTLTPNFLRTRSAISLLSAVLLPAAAGPSPWFCSRSSAVRNFLCDNASYRRHAPNLPIPARLPRAARLRYISSPRPRCVS
jgi:hypothetical protein